MAAAVFDADQQNRFIARLTGAGIKDRMRRIRPVVGGQNRIVGMAMKQLGVERGSFGFQKHIRFLGKMIPFECSCASGRGGRGRAMVAEHVLGFVVE